MDLESIHYAINLYVFSSFIVFSNFDYMFPLMYCLFESMKLFFSSKKREEIEDWVSRCLMEA